LPVEFDRVERIAFGAPASGLSFERKVQFFAGPYGDGHVLGDTVWLSVGTTPNAVGVATGESVVELVALIREAPRRDTKRRSPEDRVDYFRSRLAGGKGNRIEKSQEDLPRGVTVDVGSRIGDRCPIFGQRRRARRRERVEFLPRPEVP